MPALKSIKLNLAEKLQDRPYRTEFFRGLTQDQIAQQIRALRKERGLTQADLAKLISTTQSAVSRLEKADYSKWGFQTLMSIAEALDAHARFVLEPADKVIEHYKNLETESTQVDSPSSRQAPMTGPTFEATLDKPAP